MRALRGSRFLRHVVIPLTLMAWLSGCHKWSTTGMAPGQVVRENPDRVRVTTATAILDIQGRVADSWILESPWVEGDSLIGLMVGTGERRAIPISEIQRLEIRKFDTVGTVAAVVGIPALIVSFSVILACASASDSDLYC